MLNKFVQITCLPSSKTKMYPQVGEPAWAVGWGSLDDLGNIPRFLNNVKINILNSTLCKYSADNLTTEWDSQICAGKFFKLLIVLIFIFSFTFHSKPALNRQSNVCLLFKRI